MFKKIAFVFLGLFLLIAVIATTISVFYKKDINHFIINSANEKLNAKFSYKDISIGLIKTFPRIGIELEEVQIIGVKEFEQDTLASIPSAQFQMSITEYLFNDKIDIEKIKIVDAKLHLIVLKNGLSNWDIVKKDSLEKKDSIPNEIHIALKKYQLDNANIIYKDDLRGVYTQLNQVTHSGSGDFTKAVFTLETKTKAKKLSFSYLGKPYLSDVEATLDAPLQMNFTKMEFAFRDNELLLNELPIHFNAWFAMPDSNIDMDIRFDATKSPLKAFLSLVPVLYQNEFKDLTASGKFTFNGFVKGRMNDTQMPGFGLGLGIENGAFKYASIPAGIQDLNLKLKIDNPDGVVDHTIIDLSQLSLRLNKQLIQANLLVKNPGSNPYIDLKAKGNLDLGALIKIVPQNDLTLSGQIKTDMEAKGNVEALKIGKGFAKGNFEVNGLKYTNPSIKNALEIPSAFFTITPKKLLVNQLNLKIGKSDFKVQGSAENYFLYLIKNEPIFGTVSLTSNLVDLNELMSISSNASSDTLGTTDFDLPKHLFLNASAKISKINYKDFLITNASGGLTFAEQKVQFKKLAFNLLDATFTMDGYFAKQEKQMAETDLSFSVQNLNIKKAYQQFVLVQKFAPIAQAVQGDMNLKINFSTQLTKTLSPNLNTVNSEGDIYINNANINGSTTLNEMADLVKWAQLKSLAVQEAHLSYHIQNGRAVVKPFDVATNITKLNIGGSSGLDKTINYVIGMDMPKQVIQLGAAAGISKELAKINPNLSLDKIGKSIKMQVLLTGNMQKPILKMGLKTTGISDEKPAAPIIDQVKEVVTATVKEQVNIKLAQAQKEADAIILEAKIAADKIKKEAYDKADKMVEDTKNPFAKVGVKLVADKIKKEADNKSNQMIEAANQKAKEIIEKAKNK